MSADFNPQVTSKASARVMTTVETAQAKPAAQVEGAGQVAASKVNQSNDKQQGQEVSSSELSGMVSQLNDYVQRHSRALEFSVDDSSGETVVRVVDRKTGELIRQIPSQEMLDLSKKLDEAAGMILKVQV